MLLGAQRQHAGVDAQADQEVRGADIDRAPVDEPADTPAGRRHEPRDGRNGEAALSGRVHDGRGQRMGTAALDSGSEPKNLGILDTGDGADNFDSGDARLALRQRARLVHDEYVHPRELFQCLRVFHEHTRVRATSGSHHDGHRRGQAERARARDDQDRHAVHQGVREPGRGAPQAPGGKRRDGREDHGRNEVRGDLVREPLNGRARALRLADHPDDLRQQRVAADAFGPERERPVHADRRPDDTISGRLVHGDRLAGDH